MATIKYEDFDDRESFYHETNERDMGDFLDTLTYDELIKIMRGRFTKDELIEILIEDGISFSDLMQGEYSVAVKDFYEQEAKDAYENEQDEQKHPYGSRGLSENAF